MKPAVGDGVDALRVGVARVVTDAECEIAKRESIAVADEAEDHAELPTRHRQIDLEASWQPGPIAPFGIAAAQGLDPDTVSLELTASLPQRLRSGLPLAVCRLKRPVLCL
ncbi:MAG: hypothetical protein JWO14_3422 [Solirubrobacterales bacterium]|nr:hypothetical protein [Solirubrobacterales bacterium]